jgi:hypothetical protein
MKRLPAVGLLLLSLIMVAPLALASLARAQLGGGGITNQHRISAMSQPAQASPPAATSGKLDLWWCTFYVGQDVPHAVNYVNDTLIRADDMSTTPLTHAWSAYIHASYPVPASTPYGQCGVVSATAPGGPQRYITQMETTWKARGQEIIHVKWSYTPAPAGTAAQTSVTYMYCASDVGTSPVYFSEIFLVELPAVQHSIHSPHMAVFEKVTADFLAFIRRKYSYKTNANYAAGCPNFGSGSEGLRNAKDSKNKLQEQARASNLAVVETSWDYNSPPSSAPVAATAPTPPPASAPAPHTAIPPALVTHASAAAPAHPAPATRAVVAPAGKGYRCVLNLHQGRQSIRYSAGPIITEASQPALAEAWKNYMNTTYHPSGKVQSEGCVIIQSKPENWGNVVSAFEANSKQIGVNIVHINWTTAPKQ